MINLNKSLMQKDVTTYTNTSSISKATSIMIPKEYPDLSRKNIYLIAKLHGLSVFTYLQEDMLVSAI